MSRIGVLALLTLAIILARPVWAQTSNRLLFEDPFEEGTPSGWSVEPSETIASVKSATPGQLSPRCLQISKPDFGGLLVLRRQIPAPGGHWVVLTLGLKTMRLGPYAEYFIWLVQNDATGKQVGQGRGLAFDDGLARASEFGGQYKTPQTLGEWKTTRHVIHLEPGAASLDARIVFRTGPQVVRIDNFRLTDAGIAAPNREVPPVYAADLMGGVVLLDLDMLIPSLTYEMTITTASADHREMGVRMGIVDLGGRATRSLELPGVVERGKDLVYRFTVPYDAVRSRFDLYGNDLAIGGPYHNDKYRQFKRVVVQLAGTRPAEDTMMYNFEQGMADGTLVPQPRQVLTVTEFDRNELNVFLSSRPAVDVELRNVNGGMAVMVGGRPLAPVIACAFNWQNRYNCYGELGVRGVNIVRMDEPTGGPAMNGTWVGPGQYDFTKIDDQVYNLLKQNRNALVLLHFGGLYPPLWWGDQNPDEIIRNQDGLACSLYSDYGGDCMWGPMEAGTLGKAHEKKWAGNTWLIKKGAKTQVTYAPSPASRPYRQVMKEYLTALRRHVESMPYAGAVIGYMPHWGYDYQWGWLGNVHNYDVNGKDLPPQYTDYSQPMHAYFRAFLKERYHTAEKLRAAWHDPKVSFETAAIPPPAQRYAPTTGAKPWPYLLDPATQRNVLDYNECSARVLGGLLTDMSQAIKVAVPRKVIVGTYFQHIDRDMGQDFAIGQDGFDFSGGPDYDAREIGLSGISPHSHDSFRLHNKLDLTEVDHRIFPVVWRAYANNQLFETARKTVSVLQREFARQMCRGQGAWVLDMGFGWYNEPIPADAMGQINRVFQRVLTVDRASPAKMAIFISPDSYYAEYFSMDCNRRYWLSKHVRATMAQAGVPVDLYDVNDLPAVAGRYQVFVFPLAWMLTDEQVAQIKALKGHGNVLVFGPAAGYLGTSTRSVERVAALTGMTLKQDDALQWTVKITNTGHPLTKDLPGFVGEEETDHQTVAYPMFAVTDPAAVKLGEYVGSGGQAGLAIKDCGGWKSVYCGMMAPLPAELLRGLARVAGLPIYSTDGDVLFFANQLLAVHASSDGLKTLELPQAYRVTSLWDERKLGVLEVIRREMRTGDNALYLLELPR
jgi:hypothetical protein